MKKVVFDFDGTLLNSKERHLQVVRKAISDVLGNCEYDFSSYLEYKADGHSTKDFLRNILMLDEADATEVVKIWESNIENSIYMKYDILYNDSVEVIDQLSKKYQLVLVSARQREELLQRQLAEYELSNYFSDIICVSPFNASRQKYEQVQRYQDQIVLVVGDTEIDYECANKLGVPFYGLNRGFRSGKYWEGKNIKTFNDLNRLLELLYIKQ